MMVDVDALSRRFGRLVAQHCAIAHILHIVGIKNLPDAYDEQMFVHNGRTKIEKRMIENWLCFLYLPNHF